MWWPGFIAMILLVGGLAFCIWVGAPLRDSLFVASVLPILFLVVSGSISAAHLEPTHWETISTKSLKPLVISGIDYYVVPSNSDGMHQFAFVPESNPSYLISLTGNDGVHFAAADGKPFVEKQQRFPSGWWRFFALGGSSNQYVLHLNANFIPQG